MSDSRRPRSEPSKRKAREAPDETVTRKKQYRHAADHSDDDAQFEDHSSGRDDFQADSTTGPKGNHAERNTKEYPSINELKKRIRDVKRLLAKGRLSAEVQVLQERALAGYEQDLVEETARRQRSQMISKYHFVRFLDRKTATKQLNRLLRREKETEMDAKQQARLQKKIHEARVNLNYTIYCPLPEKYISLYPKSNAKSSDGDVSETKSDLESKSQTESTKPPLWSVVEKCMKEGTLDDLREGKLNISAEGKPIPVPEKKLPAAKSQKPKKEDVKEKKSRKEHQVRADAPVRREKQNRKDYGRERDRLQDVAVEPAGDDSDGGFFEE